MNKIKCIFVLLLVLLHVTVDVRAANASSSENVLAAQDVMIENEDRSCIFPIMLDNAASITGFQIDLYLPEGLTVAKDSSDEDYAISIFRTENGKHRVSALQQADGALRIVCRSMTNFPFLENSGVVMNIRVTVDENLEAGSYPVIIKNIVMSDVSSKRYTSPDVTCSFTKQQPPVPFTIKGATLSMVYGDQVPELTYDIISEGEVVLQGIPQITCDVTPSSQVGSYPIIVSSGSVTNKAVTLVNGTLTISKAPLTITAGTYTKKQFDPLPQLQVSYDGFKNNDTEVVLSSHPQVSCDAGEDSAPGDYAISVSGAEAVNYDIKYVAGKLTVTEPDSYKLTYMVDGRVYQSAVVKYREIITPLVAPSKVGYTFSGWSEIPETMPAKDVVVTGSFSVNSYTLTYNVDGKEYKSSTVAFGTKLTPEAAPIREGYTFSGWSEIPETMPAKDVVVTGSFSVNSYTMTYMVDGEVFKTILIAYGTELTPETEPTREGYMFSGWGEIPRSMPARDVVVVGSFSKGAYKITYMVDGELYKVLAYDYEATVVPEVEPAKEGHTFSGWSEVPQTMPAKDVVVTGTFSVNRYTLT